MVDEVTRLEQLPPHSQAGHPPSAPGPGTRHQGHIRVVLEKLAVLTHDENALRSSLLEFMGQGGKKKVVANATRKCETRCIDMLAHGIYDRLAYRTVFQ
jgi:hypothetical protein